jgi:hypothetical protein
LTGARIARPGHKIAAYSRLVNPEAADHMGLGGAASGGAVASISFRGRITACDWSE